MIFISLRIFIIFHHGLGKSAINLKDAPFNVISILILLLIFFYIFIIVIRMCLGFLFFVFLFCFLFPWYFLGVKDIGTLFSSSRNFSIIIYLIVVSSYMFFTSFVGSNDSHVVSLELTTKFSCHLFVLKLFTSSLVF